MPDTLEVRIAHLEGAYEQIDKRLTGVETGVAELRREMGANFSQLRQEMAQLRQAMETNISQLRQAIETNTSQLRQAIETNTSQLRQGTETSIAQLRQQMYEQFRWVVGIQIIAWISILGTVLALVFRS